MSSDQARSGTASLRQRPAVDYSQAPVVVFWEMTRACALVCRHCRADAQPRRHPLELSTEEGLRLVEEVARFQQRPILVITGGDPLMRRDLFRIAAHGVSQGLRISLAPSVTALVTPANLERAYQVGIRHIAFSLDGATPEVHDRFRGVEGSFQKTLQAIKAAQAAGLSVQIGTTISRWNWQQLDQMASIVAQSGAVLWSVFFLVPTGRATQEEMISAQEHEAVFHRLFELSLSMPFRIKTTLGQPYRRVALQRGGGSDDPMPTTNDGKGVCFVSHLGEIWPSGFLPVSCGNVRRHSLVEVYRHHPVFQELRDPGRLKGKCGRCPFREPCGGCRARAYACTGDYLEADPSCAFQP